MALATSNHSALLCHCATLKFVYHTGSWFTENVAFESIKPAKIFILDLFSCLVILGQLLGPLEVANFPSFHLKFYETFF